MATDKFAHIPFGVELKLNDLKNLMNQSEWEEFEKKMLTPEEAEISLQETDWIDGSELNRMLGITREDHADTSVYPPSSTPQFRTEEKHGIQ